ncbi:putative NACHT domain-containing protein [Seiridium cardinale]|uniref:NACHT domain-containing protein n=1 Tax=Seiridium cardinale TaxID=138064 RepID=A0ABR2XNP4_9PEZI
MDPKFKSLVYRLRRTPYEIDERGTVTELSSRALGIPVLDGQVCSLATIIDGISTRGSPVATVMFSKAPPKLIQTHANQNQQELRLHSSQKTLVLDSHFIGITPLNEVVAPSKHESIFIAIPELPSDPFGSCQPSGGVKTFTWLRDTLPKRLPNTKAWFFGYDTQSTDSTSFQNMPKLLTLLLTNSSRPRRYCVETSDSELGKEERAACPYCAPHERAIMFGVPNLGIDQTSLLSLVKGQLNEELGQDFARGSEFLDDLDKQFLGHQSNEKLKVFWVYETLTSSTAVVSGQPFRLILRDF